MNKTIPAVALIGALSFATFSTPAADQPQTKSKPAASTLAAGNLFADKLLAKGKGFEIRKSQLDESFIQLKANAAARGQTVPETQRGLLEARLLDRLVITQILTNKATAADRTKAKEGAEKFIADYKKSTPTEEGFQRQLKALGMSLEQFQARVMEQAIAEAVLDREVKAKVTVSDAEVKQYYDNNPKEFEQPEMVRAAHVLIATQDLATRTEFSDDQKKEKKVAAEKVLARARKGEDFSALVKEFSDDSGSKDRGGEYTFARAKDDPQHAMVPEFEAAAFSLNTNQISDIVTSQFGFHILKVNEKIPARKVELTKVSEDVREGMVRDRVQRQLPDYFDKIKKDANVEVLDPTLALPPTKSAELPVAPAEKPSSGKPDAAKLGDK